MTRICSAIGGILTSVAALICFCTKEPQLGALFLIASILYSIDIKIGCKR